MRQIVFLSFLSVTLAFLLLSPSVPVSAECSAPPEYLDPAKPPHAAVQVDGVWKESTDPQNPVLVPVETSLLYQVREYDPALGIGPALMDEDTWTDPSYYPDMLKHSWDFNGESSFECDDYCNLAQAYYSFSSDAAGLKAVRWKLRDRYVTSESWGLWEHPTADDAGILPADDPDYGVWDATGTLYVQAVDFSDTTPPEVTVTDDGSSTTSTTALHAAWSAKDAESGVRSSYTYAIGTWPGGDDVVAWTDAGTSASATRGGLSLTVGTTYYFTVKAKNWLDQEGQASSDGITVVSGGPAAAPNSIEYMYDRAGNRVIMKDQRGTTCYGYDVLGRMISVSEPNGSVITYDYDLRNCRTTMTEVVDPGHTYTTRYDYNGRGQVRRVTDRSGEETTFDYYDSSAHRHISQRHVGGICFQQPESACHEEQPQGGGGDSHRQVRLRLHLRSLAGQVGQGREPLRGNGEHPEAGRDAGAGDGRHQALRPHVE